MTDKIRRLKEQQAAVKKEIIDNGGHSDETHWRQDGLNYYVWCGGNQDIDYPDVEPTNNHAERALRKLVIFRKICFGTRSDQGFYCHSVLPSLLSTFWMDTI